MKTTSKLSIILLALLPVFILILSFTKSESVPKYATIRTVETAVGSSSKIVIAYEGKTEELDLDRGSVGNMAPNTLKINEAMNSLVSKGYELVAQSGGDYISMYSFVKK